MDPESHIRLGTSAFTAAGWERSFYPARMKSADYLSFYAERFDTVEIDSTFYGTPPPDTVKAWARKTPQGFLFSAKVPQLITHEKVLADCDADFSQFVDIMSLLGDKLGPMVLQFPFFSSSEFRSGAEFLGRLQAFMEKLPKGYKFAVEIRNREWLTARLAGLLREHRVVLILQDHSTMPRATEPAQPFDPITADWTYIRWLGDRKGIEKLTKVWDKTVVDRTADLSNWVDFCYQTARRGVTIYAYANNHYGGHSPATIDLFRDLWCAKGLPELGRPRQMHQERTLFDL